MNAKALDHMVVSGAFVCYDVITEKGEGGFAVAYNELVKSLDKMRG